MSNGRTINSNQSYRLEVTDRNSIINFYKNIPLNIDYKKEHLERIYKVVLPKLDKDHCDLSGAKLYKIVSIKHIGILTVYNLEASETHTYLANGIITHNTKQDAILGSAFMPAPVKWLNMAGAKTTQNFNNQSWLNTERTNSFMQNGFGDLGDRLTKAREEAGKTYGTFSLGARKRADLNLTFANLAWLRLLDMTDTNEMQNIRSQYMSSINNQRYALMIQGGFNPLSRKQGGLILNNATNHKVGMRLLSGAALIDNKQMILSALSGTKFKTTGGAGYVPNNLGIDIKRRLYENLSPISYEDLTRVSDAILLNKPDHYHARMKNMPVLDEIYAQYLGIPEKDRHFNTRLEKSKYKPTIGGENVTYYKLPQKKRGINERTVVGDYHWRDGSGNTYIDDMVFDATYMEPGTNKQQLNTELGYYTVGRGRDNKGDYVSYYDKWDINPFSGRLQNSTPLPTSISKALSNINMNFGTPVHIYDRIYFDDYYGVKEPTHATYLPEVVIHPSSNNKSK